MTPILQKNYLNLPVNIKEALRYAQAPDLLSAPGFEDCVREAASYCNFKVCYRSSDIKIDEDEISFDFAKVKSANLAKNLTGCKKAVIFGATIGPRYDALIERYKRLSPAKSMFFQAIGAERIETLCDAFCEDLKRQEEANLKPRFSPGYGDLDLSFQKDIFLFLDAPKRIGLTLNDSLLMSPSKSVTAIVGITNEQVHSPSGCEACGNTDCPNRITS